MYYGGGWAIVGLVWLGAVIYGLILATRLVRAVERLADKFEGRAP